MMASCAVPLLHSALPGPRLTAAALIVPTPAGAPPANATFFCDPFGVNCYQLGPGPRNYSNALRHCEGLGGTLALYKDGGSQLLVERYFGNSSSSGLGSAYWIGVNRTDSMYPFTYMDGSYLSQTVGRLLLPPLLPLL